MGRAIECGSPTVLLDPLFLSFITRGLLINFRKVTFARRIYVLLFLDMPKISAYNLHMLVNAFAWTADKVPCGDILD